MLAAGILAGCQSSVPGGKVGIHGSRDITVGEEADGTTSSGGDAEGKLQVVATLFPYYDLVREIAGDLVDVTLILPAGMDTHSFEPTAMDLIRMGEADLIIYNGGENERWVEKVLTSSEQLIKGDAMMDHVDTFLEEHVEGMQEERSGHGDGEGKEGLLPETSALDAAAAQEADLEEDGEVDEHIWTSPVNMQIIAEQIARDLSEADPAHEGEYQSRARRYIRKLKELDGKFREAVDRLEQKYLAFADRFPLRYFVEEYGLEYTAAFAGCSSDIEPSVRTIKYLTDQVRERRLPVVLKIELTSDRVARAVAEAAEAPGRPVQVETFYTCHNVTKEQFYRGETYLSLMGKNLVTVHGLGAVPVTKAS